MRFVSTALAGALAFTAVSVVAQPGPAVDEEATDTEITQPVEKPKKARKVCRSETGTGSIMAKRVCYTPEQLKQMQRQTDRDLRDLKK